MDAATWQQLKFLLADALERPSTDRLAFIERACRGRPRLYEEASSLLAEAHDDDDDFLEPVGGCDAADDDSADAEGWLGHRVGMLRIERLLASGGMGHVFLGVPDSGTGTAAAIKIPNSATCPTGGARSLEYEHEVLSRLDHPLIVHSRGTALVGGVSCLVMDYVDGVPIDSYCAQHGLGVAARVALVVRTCAALAHAHGRGVVHADLKPANLLVTPSGEPRLVDFGTARRLEDPAAPDAAAWMPRTEAMPFAAFTPECASPEQWRNRPVSPGSDVYAVGVMLHQLLTGCLPHEQEGPLTGWQRLRAVCNDDPLAPSQLVRSGNASPAPGLPPAPELARQLDGELDRIIGRALAREPRARYTDIAGLAHELAGALG